MQTRPCRLCALKSTRVPAITYRVEKSTGAEQYIVYATESLPCSMICEDFPDGTVSELLARHQAA